MPRRYLTLQARMTHNKGMFVKLHANQVVSCLHEIDLAELAFIDSTGMSLFVHVYDDAQACALKVIVRNAKGMVSDTLRRASFDTLFEFK